jgi:hypothetical protein
MCVAHGLPHAKMLLIQYGSFHNSHCSCRFIIFREQSLEPSKLCWLYKLRVVPTITQAQFNEVEWGCESIVHTFFTFMVFGGKRSSSRLGRFNRGEIAAVVLWVEGFYALYSIYNLERRNNILRMPEIKSLFYVVNIVYILIQLDVP